MDKKVDVTSQRIKELRLKNRLTMEKLAETIGVSKSTIAKWENGYVSNMKQDKVDKLAKTFNVLPTYILGYDETSSLNGEAEKLTNKEREFVTLFSMIPADQQELIVDLIKTFLSKQ